MHAPRHGCRPAPIAAALALVCVAAPAQAQLRIVTYNTYNDHLELDYSAPREQVGTVFQGLAAQNRPGFARPLDIVLLQEQAQVSTTTAAYAALLNGLVGSGTYVAGTLNGASSGGGRPGVVYNQTTVQLIAEQAVNATSGTGAALATP